MSDVTYEISKHAEARCQQRGIALETVEMVGLLADRRVRLGGNAFGLSLSEKKRDRLIASGMAPAVVDRARNVVLIVSEVDRTIITCEHAVGQKRHFRR